MRACKTAKGLERQLKRDHIAKIEGDILDENHMDMKILPSDEPGSGGIKIDVTLYPFGKPKIEQSSIGSAQYYA